jgi:hypothetical protein
MSFLLLYIPGRSLYIYLYSSYPVDLPKINSLLYKKYRVGLGSVYNSSSIPGRLESIGESVLTFRNKNKSNYSILILYRIIFF